MAEINNKIIEWLLNFETVRKQSSDFISTRDFAKYLKPGWPLNKPIAHVILPDSITINPTDDYIDTKTILDNTNDQKWAYDYFFYVIQIPFTIIPLSYQSLDWKNFFSQKLTYIRFFIKIQNKEDPKTQILIFDIFPTTEVASVGEVIKEYSILVDLSTKMFSSIVSPASIKLPDFSFKYKEIRKVMYPLKIPKILAGHAGNNEAEWMFLLKDFGPQAQYRVDVIAGFPHDASEEYEIKMKLSSKANIPISIPEINHTSTLKVKAK